MFTASPGTDSIKPQTSRSLPGATILTEDCRVDKLAQVRTWLEFRLIILPKCLTLCPARHSLSLDSSKSECVYLSVCFRLKDSYLQNKLEGLGMGKSLVAGRDICDRPAAWAPLPKICCRRRSTESSGYLICSV